MGEVQTNPPTYIEAGPDGNMWVGVDDGIVRVDPASGAVTARYTLIVSSSDNWSPVKFVEGPDGALWCTASNSQILRLTPP